MCKAYLQHNHTPCYGYSLSLYSHPFLRIILSLAASHVKSWPDGQAIFVSCGKPHCTVCIASSHNLVCKETRTFWMFLWSLGQLIGAIQGSQKGLRFTRARISLRSCSGIMLDHCFYEEFSCSITGAHQRSGSHIPATNHGTLYVLSMHNLPSRWNGNNPALHTEEEHSTKNKGRPCH